MLSGVLMFPRGEKAIGRWSCIGNRACEVLIPQILLGKPSLMFGLSHSLRLSCLRRHVASEVVCRRLQEEVLQSLLIAQAFESRRVVMDVESSVLGAPSLI